MGERIGALIKGSGDYVGDGLGKSVILLTFILAPVGILPFSSQRTENNLLSLSLSPHTHQTPVTVDKRSHLIT